jgi:hypothetical protein
MRCEQYRKQIEHMLNFEQQGNTEVMQHLKECYTCRLYLTQLKNFELDLKQSMNAVSIPGYIYPQILDRISHLISKPGMIEDSIRNKLQLIALHTTENHHQILSRIHADPVDLRTVMISQPRLKIPQNMRLIGGGKCQLWENNVDCLFYARDDEKISLYMMYADDVDLEQWEGDLQILKQNDYNVAIWRDSDLIYSMVLAAPVEEIKAMLREY